MSSRGLQGGYEPRTSAPERRDFFDLRRLIRDLAERILALESGGGGGAGVPPGGTAGQVLTKVSATDFDDAWVTPAAGGGAESFVHVQSTPASVWVIDHPLTFQPNVTVIDSSNRQVEGDVVYTTATRVTVTFSASFAGKAYLT